MNQFIFYLNWPNLVSFSGAIFALSALLLAIRGHVSFAMIGLILAGLCDLFDGLVARRYPPEEDEALIGGQLDSLNDVLCFGVLPIVIVDAMLKSVWVFPVYAVYMLCVLLRLAYFNTFGTAESEEGQAYYTGLPVTYAAMVLPLLGILPALWPILTWPVMLTALLALSGLYIYKQLIPKPYGRAYLAFPALAGLATIFWLLKPWIVVFE